MTAWQQLRGRAIRARQSWSNDCYRLESLILDSDPLSFAGEDEGPAEEALDETLRAILEEIASPALVRRVVAGGFGALSATERADLATALMQARNKVTHVYELVKAFGSTSQVSFDRGDGRWRRKVSIAVKHDREVAVDPLGGHKSHDEAHAPLLYVEDPRADLPAELRTLLETELTGADERIIKGWLGVDE